MTDFVGPGVDGLQDVGFGRDHVDQMCFRANSRRRVLFVGFAVVGFLLIFCAASKSWAGLRNLSFIKQAATEETRAEKQMLPATPTGVSAGVSAGDATGKSAGVKSRSSVLMHCLFALIAGVLISAASLRMRFRRLIGLGVFANLYALLFLLLGALVCNLPQIPANLLGTQLRSAAMPWVADLAGVICVLFVGKGLRGSESEKSGGITGELQSTSNVLFAVVEDGIRDRVLRTMQVVAVQYAKKYDWATIQSAGKRTVAEEIAVGRIGREDGKAAVESLDGLSSGPQPTEVDRKYRAIMQLISCCPVSRLELALAQAGGRGG